MVDDAGATLAPADVERAVDLWVRAVAFNTRQVQPLVARDSSQRGGHQCLNIRAWWSRRRLRLFSV